MTLEEMAQELRKAGWDVQPPRNRSMPMITDEMVYEMREGGSSVRSMPKIHCVGGRCR